MEKPYSVTENTINVQTGRPKLRWTKKAVLESALQYTDKVRWKEEVPGAYAAAQRKGWIDEACEHMVPLNPKGKWSDIEDILADAQKYQTRSEWQKKSSGAYEAAIKKGIFDDAVAHMKVVGRGWTRQEIIDKAIMFDNKST